MNRTAIGLCVAASISLAVGSCGGSNHGLASSGVAEAPPCVPESFRGDVLPIDWDKPFAGDVELLDIAAAQDQMPFPILVPRLGQLRHVTVTTKYDRDTRYDRAVALVYDTAEYGRIVVREYLSETSQEKFDQDADTSVARNDDPTTFGRADIATIRGGKRALVGRSPDCERSTVVWLENGISMHVKGPSLSFNDAIEVANAL